ncbi:MAG: uS10/mL48 family ribosomal protein [Bacteroidota bacterium]
MKQTGKHWKVSILSMDSRLLDSVVKKIAAVAQTNLIKFSALAMPSSKKLFSVLRSPFVYKTAMDQYFLIKKKRVIYLYLKPGQSIDLFRDISIPSGMELEVKPVN